MIHTCSTSDESIKRLRVVSNCEIGECGKITVSVFIIFDWKEKQILYWNEKEIKRSSLEYQNLLDAAFNALSTNEGFQNALLASGKSVLEHTIGRTSPRDTVLTRAEFCGRLTKIRERLQEEKLSKSINRFHNGGGLP